MGAVTTEFPAPGVVVWTLADPATGTPLVVRALLRQLPEVGGAAAAPAGDEDMSDNQTAPLDSLRVLFDTTGVAHVRGSARYCSHCALLRLVCVCVPALDPTGAPIRLHAEWSVGTAQPSNPCALAKA